MARITVVMGVHNGERYLAEAVDSVLAQTFGDFRFVVVDDASSDATAEILAGFGDPRLEVLRNERNLGLPGSLNRALERVDSPLVARMDADDRCHPERLARQLAFLEANPDIGLLGTAATLLLETGATAFHSEVTHPYEPEEIKAVTLFSAALVHPSILVNLEAFDRRLFFYRPEFVPAADYECWVRLLSQGVRFACLRERLLCYRQHHSQISRTARPLQQNTGDAIRLKALELAGIAPTAEEFALHRLVSERDHRALAAAYPRLVDWFGRILEANAVSGYYRQAALRRVLLRRLEHIVEKAAMPPVQAGVAAWLAGSLAGSLAEPLADTAGAAGGGA